MGFKSVQKAVVSDGQKAQQKRIARCKPAIKEIYKLLAETDMPIQGEAGVDYEEALKTVYSDITLKVMHLLGDSGIGMGDINFMCLIANNPLASVTDNLNASLERAMINANEILWGKEKEKVTMEDVNKVLLSKKS